jgi:NADH-quinone oxidoreductase subunit H
MVMVVVMIWLERRVVALMQNRLGPNRVGFQGILQPVADAVKLFFKENIMQRQADKFLFNISPVLVMFSSLLAFCFVPLGEPIRIGNYTLTLWIAESPVGLLIILGLSSIAVFGVIFGGWASNSKYPLMGALRSVVQVLSYEIPIGLTVLTVAFIARSMDLVEIVRRQESSGVWYGFLMPVSFVVFWISAVAETNRAPFDLPEAESELVAGYHTEYSGMKFAYFYMAEYAHMVLASSLVVILFFGGWLPPFPSVKTLAFLHVVPGFIWYLIKIMFFLYLYVWIRATFPRYRFDSLIRLVWKWLIPLSLVNFLAVALARYLL